MERRDFFKKMGLFAAMFGIGGKLKAQDAQPAENKADAPKETDTKLIFLGTAHGAVTPTRFHSATLLQVGGKNYLIDAGDAIQGAPIGAISNGAEIIRMMNRLGYDLAVPGNHEFDFGFEALDACAEALECGYTCAMVGAAEVQDQFVSPSAISILA